MATVSLCMIVKNEAAVLGRCLDSIQGGVDEIIIVDTGSEDETKEIAARYTDKIFDFEWIDDFSAARNFSFAKATMEYAMWLDADDVFTQDDLAAFIQMKETLPEDADVVMLRYNTAFDEAGNPTFYYYRERLVRKSIDFCWKGRVHEAIVHSGRPYYSNVAVTHKSIKTRYSDRNLRIYEKQVELGEELAPRDQFYYGRELYYHRFYEKAKLVLQNYLSANLGWMENNIEACKILSYCFAETGNVFGALHALTASFRYDSPRAEICCEIGKLFLQAKNYRVAAFWYELALKTPKNDLNGAFVAEDSYGYIPCIQLCVCYDRLQDRKKAEEYNRLAGTYRPQSPAYQQNLKYFESQKQNA